MNQDSQDSAIDGLGQLGGYRLLSELGVGAAGQVYLARQQDPAREVAIKVLRSASASGRQRFEREVSLLASLEHTNIARLYDAGTESGPAGDVPYLVMEYVRGQDLIAYAQAESLSTAQRLALMAQVARAAHFAHTRGVIHRDLKPANILVNERGEPKILDFGVAHVTADDATQMTGAGEILGTLAYMSWEQLCGEAKQVDARSDVYALGVIAYELLSGELPYPGLRSDTLISALGRMQRESPQKLSAHLPAARGDIETLVMKALSQDAAQRYGSAAEFAADIERYLKQQPIEARPPTLGYVLGLFVRRHKALSAAAGLALASLLAAVAVSLSFAVSETRARAAAESRLAEREAVTQFLSGMLTSADPAKAMGEKVTVVDALNVAAAELSARKDLPAGSRSQLQRALGNTYVGLGRYEDGLKLLEAARNGLISNAESGGFDSTELALEFSAAYLAAGREADAMAELSALDPATHGAHREKLALAKANVLINQGHFDQVETLLAPYWPAASGRMQLGDELSLNLAGVYAHALQSQSKFSEALPVAQAALEATHQAWGQNHPRYTQTAEVVANIYRDLGNFDEAIPLFEAIIDRRKQIFGQNHTNVYLGQIGLAATLALSGNAEAGLPPAQQAHQGLLEILGPDAEMTRAAASLLAYVASEADQLALAARINQGLIDQAEAKPDGPSMNDLVEYNNLGNNYKGLGRLAEAQQTFARLIALGSGMLPQDHLHLAIFRGNYADVLRMRRNFSAAIEQIDLAMPVLVATLGAEHARVAIFQQRRSWAEQADPGAY